MRRSPVHLSRNAAQLSSPNVQERRALSSSLGMIVRSHVSPLRTPEVCVRRPVLPPDGPAPRESVPSAVKTSHLAPYQGAPRGQ